jgi:hypothetical protein
MTCYNVSSASVLPFWECGMSSCLNYVDCISILFKIESFLEK